MNSQQLTMGSMRQWRPGHVQKRVTIAVWKKNVRRRPRLSPKPQVTRVAEPYTA